MICPGEPSPLHEVTFAQFSAPGLESMLAREWERNSNMRIWTCTCKRSNPCAKSGGTSSSCGKPTSIQLSGGTWGLQCKLHVRGLLPRRIPLLPERRQYAHIAFRRHGQAYVAKHLSCMFGAVSSVHHWERVGTKVQGLAMMLAAVARAARPAAQSFGAATLPHASLQICR